MTTDNSGHTGLGRSVVAIVDAGGTVRGTGWLITGNAVVTCDHVVRACENDPLVQVGLAQPLRPSEIERFEGADLAVLRVAGQNTTAMSLSRRWTETEPLVSHGFEKSYSQADWPYGHPMQIGAASGRALSRRDGDEQWLVVIDGPQVDEGLSGAPVWSPRKAAVVGVIARSNHLNSAYMVEIDALIGRWPEFEVNTVRQSPPMDSHMSWPDEPPSLKWPMADHANARAAFAALLTKASKSRVLLVRGPSETGKSHMSKQMLVNGVNLGLACGRFDFKGTTGIGIEIESFVQHLEVEPPQGKSLSERLGKTFGELKERPRPTLLLFDTYEAAGEVRDWVERVVLQHLISPSATWLRVVVIGQSVPTIVGTPWESVTATTISLAPPGPQDWLEYGRLARPDNDVDIDFVTQVHRCADGKATLLAGLLGPQP
jgi:hypothetical protein